MLKNRRVARPGIASLYQPLVDGFGHFEPVNLNTFLSVDESSIDII